MQKYLEEANLPKITAESAGFLEEPITHNEIYAALKETPSGKSPGPDGFQLSTIKNLKNNWSQNSCNYLNNLGENEEIRKESLLANISVIPKAGKDSTICSNYRPIALLNADTKLYAKVLASRLKNLLPDLINVDQAGFVPGREGRDNSIRTILLMNKEKEDSSPMVLILINAEKALNRVDWGFMMESSRSIGLGPRVMNKSHEMDWQLIQTSYSQGDGQREYVVCF